MAGKSNLTMGKIAVIKIHEGVRERNYDIL